MGLFSRRTRPTSQLGAAFAEYLPLTSVVLLSMAVAAAYYGDAIKGPVAAIAAQLAGAPAGIADGGGAGTSDPGPTITHPDPTGNEAPAVGGATDFGPYLAAFSQGFWRGAVDRFAVLMDFARRHALTAQHFTEVAAAFYLDPEAMQARLREEFGMSIGPADEQAPSALGQWLATTVTPAELAALATSTRAQMELGRATGPLASLCATSAGAAQAGCDIADQAREMGERVTAILAQVPGRDHALLATELDAHPATKLAMLERAALADAWTTLHTADYPEARASLERLTQTADLLEHPDLVPSGFSQGALRSLIKGNNGPEGAELEQLLTGLDTLIGGDAVFENVPGLVRELELGGNFSVGTRFVLRDMTANAAQFAGARVEFETPQAAASGVSHIDLVVESKGQRQLLEYTSIKQVPPPGFAKAFASDLSSLSVTSLSQLSWRFDGGKLATLPRAEMLAALGRMELDESVLTKFGAPDTAALVAQIDARFDLIFELR